MDAGLTTDPASPRAVQRRRAHLLGFVGVNLALGALCLWFIPLVHWLRNRPAGEAWSAAQLIQPWASAGSTLMPLSLFAIAGVVAAVIIGIALVCHAARLLGEDGR
jgi:hypothetical protein